MPCSFDQPCAGGGNLAHADAVVALDVAAEDGVEHARRHRGTGKVRRLAPAHHLPDVVRVPKVVAHELLDRQHAFAAAVAHHLGHAELLGSIEQVLGRVGVEVHFVAQPQQEGLGVLQAVVLELRHRPLHEEPLGVGLAMLGEADPAEQMDVAQAAARALHVRFEQVEALAVLVALLGAGVVERLADGLRALADHAIEQSAKVIVQRLAAGDQPAVDQRRADHRVGAGERDRFLG